VIALLLLLVAAAVVAAYRLGRAASHAELDHLRSEVSHLRADLAGARKPVRRSAR
jgi:hypothetical protein